MIAKEIKEFYENLLKEPKIKEKLANELKGIKNEAELKQAIKKEVMPIVRERKLNFTENDLINYEMEAMKKLNEEELLNVSGGVSLKSVLMSSGLLMMTAIGTGAITGQQADAAISKDLIMETVVEIRPDAVGREPEAVEGYADAVGREPEAIEREEEPEPPTYRLYFPEMQQEAEESIIGILQRSQNQYIMKSLNLLDPYLLHVSGTTERFRFFDGNTTKVQLGRLGGDGLPCWEYNKSSGEGSPNFMVSLFPSSGGRLNSLGGYPGNHPFTQNCAPTPELVAKIAAYIHNYIRCADQGTKQQAHQALEDILKINSFKFSAVGNELGEKFNNLITSLERADQLTELDSLESIEKACRDLKKCCSPVIGSNFRVNQYTFQELSSLKERIRANAKFKMLQNRRAIQEFFNRYLGINLNYMLINDTTDRTVKDNIENGKYIGTILHILHNAEYMIDNQEENGADQERILPKYTAERMLMSYFIDRFNTKEDVQKFYKEVMAKIRASEGESDTEAAWSRIENLIKTLGHISLYENSPYERKVYENSYAHKICQAEDGESFLRDTFADCAETAVRHIINLLAYDGNADQNKWSYILGKLTEEDKRALDAGVTEVLQSIGRCTRVEMDRDLREKLRLFFYFQAKEDELGGCNAISGAHQGADDDSTTARSFWNYVISNMDTNVPDGYYQIKYKQAGNELLPGYENCLKLIYNLIYALKGEEADLEDDLQSARDAIDTFSEDKSEDNLEDAVEKTLKLIRDDIRITLGDIEDVDDEDDEVYGKIEVEKGEDFEFTIEQLDYHALVDFTPIRVGGIDTDDPDDEILMDFIIHDPVAQTLFELLPPADDDDDDELMPFTKFNSLFAVQTNEANEAVRVTQYFKNYCALKALKNLQNDGNNAARIEREISSKEWCFDTDIIAALQGNAQEQLKYFLFKNYVLDKDIDFITPLDSQYFNANDRNPIYRIARQKGLVYTEATNQMEYLCRINDGTVYLCPLIKANVQPDEITIPARVQLGTQGNWHRVTGIFYGYQFFKHLNDLGIRPRVRLADGIDTFYIGKNIFKRLSLQDIQFPESLQILSIGTNAFKECQDLTSITFPVNLRSLSIENSAFNSCGDLTRIIFPENLRNLSIGHYAYKGCVDLASIDFPASLQSLSIEDGAFSGCESLRILTFQGMPEGLDINPEAFYGCESFRTVKVPQALMSAPIWQEKFDGKTIEALEGQ